MDGFSISVLGLAVGVAFIPSLVAALERNEAAFRNLTGKALPLVAGGGAALAVAFYVLAPRLVAWFGPGFPPPTAALAASLVRDLAPLAFFGLLTAYFTALSQVHRRFLVPAAVPALIDLMALAFLLAGERALGPHSATLGVVAGSAVATLAVFWSLPEKTALLPRLGWDPAFWRVGALFAPSFLGATATLVTQLVERYLASALPTGLLAALSFATKVALSTQLVLLSAFPIVLFPTFATQAAAADRPALARSLGRGISLILFLGLPTLVLLEALRLPVLALVFHRGAFTLNSVTVTARILSTYALVIPALGLSTLYLRALYALQEAGAAIWSILLGTAVNVAADFLLLPHFRETTFGLGAALGAAVTAVVAWWRLSRRLPTPLRPAATGWRLAGPLSLLALVEFGLPPLLPPFAYTAAAEASRVLFLAGAGLLVYLGAGHLWGVEEVPAAINYLKQLFGPKQAKPEQP